MTNIPPSPVVKILAPETEGGDVTEASSSFLFTRALMREPRPPIL